MLFRRREPPSLKEKVRVALWPRRSWGRSFRYIVRRVWRLHGTPHGIAIGCAAGVFISFTPFLGLHFIGAGLIAWVLGGNIAASAFGTFIGNPVTFPFIWIASYKLGNLLLGVKPDLQGGELSRRFAELSEGLLSTSTEVMAATVRALWPVIKPMTIGGTPLGLIAGALGYYLTRRMVEVYQSRRREDRSATKQNIVEI
jgi:hypothetical protein